MRGKSYRSVMSNINEELYHANIYVVSTTNGIDTLYKLGYSSNMQDRLRSYIQSNPLTRVEFLGHIEDGDVWESEFHKRFKASFGNEWYSETTFKKFEELLSNPKDLFNINIVASKSGKTVKKKMKEFTEEDLAIRKAMNKDKRSLMMKELNNKRSEEMKKCIEKYIIEHGSINTTHIAKALNISRTTVIKYKKELGY